MTRYIAFFGILPLSVAFAQQHAASVYDLLEQQYEDLVGVYVAGGVCPERSAAVMQKQRALASLVAEASPSSGPRVLLFAVAANSLENVRRLTEAGAPRLGDNGSLLHTAARLADPPMLEYLTSIGFKAEDSGGAGAPALIVAVTSHRLDNAQWLIEHGANVNATDLAGGPALRRALVCKDQSAVDLLIKAGAMPDPNTVELAQRLGLRL